jgi:hypothetical protein
MLNCAHKGTSQGATQKSAAPDWSPPTASAARLKSSSHSIALVVGFGRILTLHNRASTSCQIHEEIQ